MASEKRVYNRRSNVVESDGSAKLPTSEQLDYGEIAINYAAGVETMSIKNSDDEIVSFSLNTNDMSDLYDAVAMHMARNDNPHGVTKDQVGLGNVDNTSDADKPVSTAQQTALDTKLNNAANGGIADDLTTNSSEVALSAAQGILLQQLIESMTGGAIADLQELEARVSAVEEEINEAIAYIDETLYPKAVEVHELLTI